MADSLPVSNVDFDPNRYASEHPNSKSSNAKSADKRRRKEKESESADEHSDEDRNEKRQKKNQTGVGGQLDMEA